MTVLVPVRDHARELEGGLLGVERLRQRGKKEDKSGGQAPERDHREILDCAGRSCRY